MKPKRLIQNDDIILDGTAPRYKKETEAFHKLGEYEELEAELGIDLPTLLKAISNEKGIWKKLPTGELINTRAMLTCEFGCWRIYDKEWIFETKDYGETWALTRGELE